MEAELREAIAANLGRFPRIEAPADGLKPAAVALCVVIQDDSPALLITRRAPTLRNHAGQWALPGGRRDPGESAGDAAVRELREETGVRVSAGRGAGRARRLRHPVGLPDDPGGGVGWPGHPGDEWPGG